MKNLSFAATVCHCSSSLMLANGDPRGGSFYPTLTFIIDPYIAGPYVWWQISDFYLKIEPVHEISNNVVCATSKASDQPANTHSLNRAFASCLSIL